MTDVAPLPRGELIDRLADAIQRRLGQPHAVGWAWAPALEVVFLDAVERVEAHAGNDVDEHTLAFLLRRYLASLHADQRRQAEACVALGLPWPPAAVADEEGVELDAVHTLVVAEAREEAARLAGSPRPWRWCWEAGLDGDERPVVVPSDFDPAAEVDLFGVLDDWNPGVPLVVTPDELPVDAELVAARGRGRRAVPAVEAEVLDVEVVEDVHVGRPALPPAPTMREVMRQRPSGSGAFYVDDEP